MQTGSKLVKPNKSKFKQSNEKETFKEFRKKHRDKATYRLLKQEEMDDVNEIFPEEDRGITDENF
jgi:hypothetical protein